MDYATARGKIKTGDLLFWSSGSWSSWHDIQVLAVRLFTLSEYSHVGVAWVANGRVFVIHATGRGVIIEPLSLQGSFYWVPMRTKFSAEALEAGFSRVGERYSKMQAIAGFLRRLPIGSDPLWQCAEFVIWFYAKNGIALSHLATPAGVAKSVMALGREMVLVKNG